MRDLGRTNIQRVGTLLVLLCFLLLVADGCDGERARTRTVPEPGHTLAAGTYVTTEFEPAFSFRVGEGWEPAAPEIPDLLEIASLPEDRVLITFSNPRSVYDPDRPAEEVVIPVPEDWGAWFRNHPYLDTGKAVPVTIGDASGVEFETEVSPAPRNFPQWCGVPCVPTWPLSDGSAYAYAQGVKGQTTILNVGGETVIIGVGVPEALADESEALSEKAQSVLDTVEWTDQ